MATLAAVCRDQQLPCRHTPVGE